jgi:pimeloyl-ACP methyl ester carboxylesterase
MKGDFIEKQVAWEDCSISYFQGGKASMASPILFLHGWSVGVEPYQDSLNSLAQRYQVIAPYLPGFGKSKAPNCVQDYSDYAEVMIDFINILKLPKVHVIGHSIAGAIALALAALKPSLVRSITIVDSTGIPLGSPVEVLLKRAIEMPAQMGQMKIEPVLEMFKSLLYNSLFNPDKVIQAAWVAIEKDIRLILPKIESPCLVLWGANDLLTPLPFAQEFSQGIKGSKLLVLDGLYHEWILFFPEKFTAIVSDFIDEIERESVSNSSGNW